MSKLLSMIKKPTAKSNPVDEATQEKKDSAIPVKQEELVEQMELEEAAASSSTVDKMEEETTEEQSKESAPKKKKASQKKEKRTDEENAASEEDKPKSKKAPTKKSASKKAEELNKKSTQKKEKRGVSKPNKTSKRAAVSVKKEEEEDTAARAEQKSTKSTIGLEHAMSRREYRLLCNHYNVKSSTFGAFSWVNNRCKEIAEIIAKQIVDTHLTTDIKKSVARVSKNEGGGIPSVRIKSSYVTEAIEVIESVPEDELAQQLSRSIFKREVKSE